MRNRRKNEPALSDRLLELRFAEGENTLRVALPARIIEHVRENRGALALLEDALFELWRRRRGVWLTHQAYEENGGTT